MYFSERKGVYFVEGTVPGAKSFGSISSELNDLFSQSQLKSLDDLKERMSQLVRSRGGNAVVSFKYGQRSSFWKNILWMDNVHWYGTGIIAKIDPSTLQN